MFKWYETKTRRINIRMQDVFPNLEKWLRRIFRYIGLKYFTGGGVF
jgi:hypothetical protein